MDNMYFKKLLYTCTMLSFFLSISALALQKSEGVFIGSFEPPIPKGSNFVRVIPKQTTKVAGYEVNAALLPLQYIADEDPVLGGPGGSSTSSTTTISIALRDSYITSTTATLNFTVTGITCDNTSLCYAIHGGALNTCESLPNSNQTSNSYDTGTTLISLSPSTLYDYKLVFHGQLTESGVGTFETVAEGAPTDPD